MSVHIFFLASGPKGAGLIVLLQVLDHSGYLGIPGTWACSLSSVSIQ